MLAPAHHRKAGHNTPTGYTILHTRTCVVCKATGDWHHYLIEKRKFKKTDTGIDLFLDERNSEGIICDECHDNPGRFVQPGIRPAFTFRRSRSSYATPKEIAKLGRLR